MENYSLMSIKLNDNQDLTEKLLSLNQKIEIFGVTISTQTAIALLENRRDYLRSCERYEFGEAIIEKIIKEFSDSPYIDQNTFLETMDGLQYIFYYYKNELGNSLSDDELILYMREHFDDPCFGSLSYLEETILDNLLREVKGL